MNTLYLCHRFPFPPKRGGKIRPFIMIRHFAASGHQVTVCSLGLAQVDRVRALQATPSAWGYRFEGAKMIEAEKRLARRFDLCTTTTRAEWQTLEGYATGAATDWFPNGVDSEYFCPADEPYDTDTISFVGRMDYYPNQECMSRLCDQVWLLLSIRQWISC